MSEIEELLKRLSGASIASNPEYSSSEDENDDETRKSALARAGNLRMAVLKNFDIPPEILNIDKDDNSELLRKIERSTRTRSSQMKYIRAYTTMIYLEETEQSQFLLQFNVKNLRISHNTGRIFSIKNDKKVEEIDEAINESLLDCFTLKPVQILTNVPITGRIQGSNKDNIFLEISEESHEFLRRNCDNMIFDMQFHINRIPFQLQHNALEWLVSHNLFDLLINNPKYELPDDATGVAGNFIFSGKLSAELNEEQKAAVKCIVNAENFPLPYLLFGPAGTGKTRTLVAAIEEIVRSSSKCVLVCANSNAACDEITERLLTVLKKREIFRMYAKSYDKRKLDEDILAVCNLVKGEFTFPPSDYLYKFRVLVCTLTTSGCLTRAMENWNFRSDHFSHVIIDECASTHEPVSLIPIAGLCTSPSQVNSSIVLAGDPKQLDAVTKSGRAAKIGYKTSWMEHLFNRPLYRPNMRTGKYNPKYITQLVKNYRSHSAILHIPNTLFYENKLQAAAPKSITDWFIGSNLLPNKSFPIIFKSVKGFCKQSQKDFSLFNKKEVDVVMDFIKQLLANRYKTAKPLLQSDIGVVTPYKLQCKIIGRETRKNNLNDITVGTAEIFQGQERPVMIVSTVRTNGTLGFVKDPRRLNVVITRAKSLLIIVGDVETLYSDPNWKELIQYCFANKAII